MALAITNSPSTFCQQSAFRRPQKLFAVYYRNCLLPAPLTSKPLVSLKLLSLPRSSFALLLFLLAVLATGRALKGEELSEEALTRQKFAQARRELDAAPQSPEAIWHFARAAFDLGDVATNSTERSEVAQVAISACKEALAGHPNSVQLRYYLGLNMGQLARTRSLGALKLVDQMEVEFTKAIQLDPSFDYAGPDRSLGLLYRDAPALASIGSRTKARIHLQRALDVAPRFPENRLTWIESQLKWGDRKGARQDLKLLEDAWPAAHGEFAGPSWTASWKDWESRLEKIRKILEEPARLETPRH